MCELVKRFIFISLILLVTVYQEVKAQRSDKTVTYEELYDDPYDINKLFVHFQPLYADFWIANINSGLGLEVQYYWADKFNFRAHARTTYVSKFDLSRDIAEKNSYDTILANQPVQYLYYEAGATYHIKDFEEDTETKMVLYRKSYSKGNKWAATVPLDINIPSKVRKIYGARLGGIGYQTTFQIDERFLEAQGITLSPEDTLSASPVISPETNISAYSNLRSAGFYLGASYSIIKNFAVKPDRTYGVLTNDIMFNAFFDFIIMPFTDIEPLEYIVSATESELYPIDDIQTTFFGFRLGMDGKFNREFGWGYGAEIGLRPGLAKRGFYASVRVSFPIYGTQLQHTVEAFGK